ncbi:hypothetical protein K435DRAFT_869569 [Dendrothele bispora CBS 962.96]|uniref:Uncharacterized protein n=1 Tax=Dendrothele bispora (strain CBS 962.96) TaxID=1314807 RepID=A0A4S8L8V7_DENBC|nr:hypothetical protein K435DRAFT_869569 [Dendrothele bispora CBS 962.96]
MQRLFRDVRTMQKRRAKVDQFVVEGVGGVSIQIHGVVEIVKDVSPILAEPENRVRIDQTVCDSQPHPRSLPHPPPHPHVRSRHFFHQPPPPRCKSNKSSTSAATSIMRCNDDGLPDARRRADARRRCEQLLELGSYPSADAETLRWSVPLIGSTPTTSLEIVVAAGFKTAAADEKIAVLLARLSRLHV